MDEKGEKEKYFGKAGCMFATLVDFKFVFICFFLH
jgi:hypothetical protein